MENQNEKLGVVIALAGALMGCSDPEPNIEIETFNKVNQLFGVNYVQVKVKTIQDDVTVEDIIVNKGNCKIENQNAYTRKPIIPKQLKFGESVSVAFTAPCETTQVDVVTNNGSWTVSY